MSREVAGPHEFQSPPPVAFARQVVQRATDTSGRLRRLPISTLEFASRVTPFATVRTSLAVTETLVRRALGVAEDTAKAAAPRLYPGARDGLDEEAYTAPVDPRMSVRSMVHELLDRSVRQSPQQAVETSQKLLLLQLVPDEARILNVLYDEKPRVMEFVGPGSMGGSIDRAVLRFAATVGTEAGVRCPDAVPDYLAHLVGLDLVEVGPEDESLREQYEILDTYGSVEAAEEAAKAEAKGSLGKRLRLKTVQRERHTITISKRGKDLWDAARPDTHAFAKADQRKEPDVDMSGDLPPEP